MTEEAKKRIQNRAAEMRNQCEQDIVQMTEEATAFEQHEQNRKSAVALYDIYQCYIDTGFSKEEAWELVKILMVNGTKRTLI